MFITITIKVKSKGFIAYYTELSEIQPLLVETVLNDVAYASRELYSLFFLGLSKMYIYNTQHAALIFEYSFLSFQNQVLNFTRKEESNSLYLSPCIYRSLLTFRLQLNTLTCHITVNPNAMS